VSLFVILVGEALGYDTDRQIEIGMAGLLHEVGMALIPDKFLFKPGPLSAQEYETVRQHSEFGYQILKIHSDQFPYLAEVALQVHERIDGSGYPQGLQGEEIHEYAQVIGLVDIYEALSHSRPYRDRFHHFYAIKEIIKTCKVSFQRKHLKALLNTVSIFPLSTLVRLNSNAIGRVIQTFPDRPMRPRLRIEFDSQGRKVLTQSIVHLPDNPLLYIVDSVEEDEIRLLGNDTFEVVRTKEAPSDPYLERPQEIPTEAAEETGTESEKQHDPSPGRPQRKRAGWFRRAIGLGILVLVLAGAVWQWYRPVDRVSMGRNTPEPIRQKAPPSEPAKTPPDIVSGPQNDIVPLVNKVPPARVIKHDRPNADLPRPAPAASASAAATVTHDASASIPESMSTPKPILLKKDTGARVPVAYPYSVLLGSFRSLVLAERSLSNYQKKGLPVYRVTVHLGEDGIWHRLFAGYFEYGRDAEEFIATQRLGGALVKRTRFAAGLGAFQTAAVATEKGRSLRDKGFSPYIIEDDAHRYRLMVGAFYTEAGAARQVAELAENGFVGQVVKR